MARPGDHILVTNVKSAHYRRLGVVMPLRPQWVQQTEVCSVCLDGDPEGLRWAIRAADLVVEKGLDDEAILREMLS